jgi:hypothetical protein
MLNVAKIQFFAGIFTQRENFLQYQNKLNWLDFICFAQIISESAKLNFALLFTLSFGIYEQEDCLLRF